MSGERGQEQTLSRAIVDEREKKQIHKSNAFQTHRKKLELTQDLRFQNAALLWHTSLNPWHL